MTVLATSDLTLSSIQSILSDTGDASFYDMCNHANVDPMGLSPTYCAGAGVTARHTTLKGPPCKIGNFRGYTAPNGAIMCVDMGDIVVYRGVLGETLHSSKAWSFGFQYYTGSDYITDVFNQTTRLCNTVNFADYEIDFGAVNATITGPHTVGSPNWYRRYEDETWTWDVSPGTYYWMLSVGVSTGFWSDDFGEAPYYYVQMSLADYLLSDPDEFLSFPAGGNPDSFGVWTGVYTTTTVAFGSVYLTGTSAGTGNRTQNFTVPENTTGNPITHRIITTGTGVSASNVYIYQNA